MNECLGNYNPNNAKVYADPKGFRGGASIALQKADYTYTNLLSSSIEKVVKHQVLLAQMVIIVKMPAVQLMSLR